MTFREGAETGERKRDWSSSSALFGSAVLTGGAALGFATGQPSAYGVVHGRDALLSLVLALASGGLLVVGAAEIRADRRAEDASVASEPRT